MGFDYNRVILTFINFFLLFIVIAIMLKGVSKYKESLYKNKQLDEKFTEVLNEFIKKILDSYINEHFYINNKGWYKAINTRITEQFEMDGLKKNNQLQIIDGFHIYPSEYFCGYNTDIREPEITENTICWHHYLGSWSKPTIKMRFQNIIKKIIGINAYKKLIFAKRKLTNYIRIRSKKI